MKAEPLEAVMANENQVTVVNNVASFRALPGNGDRLGAALAELVAPSRSEPGCLRYEVYEAEDDDRAWLVLENWRNADAFDHHMSTSYVSNFLAQLPELCGDDVVIRRYHHRSTMTDPSVGVQR
jgi:quinol monooxygenase YgiN